jgi:sigma-B regulation protein RsbQ
MWDKITPAFAASHRQVLFDYVGSGKSDLASFDVTRYSNLDGYVQDVLDICDALNLKNGVTFIGPSVSASIGLLASIARPELFDRLILIGPTPCFLNHPPSYLGGFDAEDLTDLLALMDHNYIGWANYIAPVIAGEIEDGAVSGELSDSFCSTDPVAARIFAKTTFFSDTRIALPSVSRPCLILQHRHDNLAPLAIGDYIHKNLLGSTLKVMDVSGHCAHMSHPSLVTEAIKEYLSAPQLC